jgi:hypothetical protein
MGKAKEAKGKAREAKGKASKGKASKGKASKGKAWEAMGKAREAKAAAALLLPSCSCRKYVAKISGAYLSKKTKTLRYCLYSYEKFAIFASF